MKLYYSPGACSLSPHIVVCEAGIKCDLEKVDLAAKKTEHGADFLKTNPKGQVPALLLDDGNLLTEGVAIIQYLADQAPEKNLMPKTGFARYHALEWLNYIASELHKGFSPLFNPKTPDEYKALTREQLQQKWIYVNHSLNGQDFLLGNNFTIADAYLYTILTWARGMGFDLASLPNIVAFMKRMEDRPSVKAALAAEKK